MSETTPRPVLPTPAGRARSIARRGGQALLQPTDTPAVHATPLLHHVHPDTTATLLLETTDPLVSAMRQNPFGELPAVLGVLDPAPLPLREPVRGRLSLIGSIRLLDGKQAHDEVLTVAEQRPDSRLLEAGHGATVVRLSSTTLAVTDTDGSQPVHPDEFAAVRPDPFCLIEDEWLQHLEIAHRPLVDGLARHLPTELHGGQIWLLGVDTYGLRLRVETSDRDHDLRLLFPRPALDTQHLMAAVDRLLNHPLPAQRHPN